MKPFLKMKWCFVFLFTGLLALGLRPVGAASLTLEQVQQAAEAHIRQQVPVCEGGQLSIEWQGKIAPVLLNLAHAQTIQLQVHSSLEQFLNPNTLIQITLQGNEGSHRTLSLPVRLHLKRPVYVVTSPINAGQPLAAAGVKQEQQEVTQGLANQLPPHLELAHYSARIQLHVGQVLDNRNVVQTPDVKGQQEVRIMLKTQDGACISVAGKALENGFIGQSIHVRQTAFHRKDYIAKVQSAGQVLVEL